MNITIYGLGQFGFALLKHLDRITTGEMRLSGYDSNQEVIRSLKEKQEHAYLYKGYKISNLVSISHEPEVVLRNADIVIVSVPSNLTRSVLAYFAQHTKKHVIFMNTAKALDYETGNRLSELYKEALHKHDYRYAFFAGGTIAQDLFNQELLGAVIASDDEKAANQLKQLIQTDKLRISISTDLKGAEYASAFKNVISILAGIVHGKGFGYGSETFIISRVADEVERMIIHELGGKKETFSLGSQVWGNDMIMSSLGKTRNREYGILIGKGHSPNEAYEQMLKEKKTVEGIKTLEAMTKITKSEKYPLLNYLYDAIIMQKDIDLLSVVKSIH